MKPVELLLSGALLLVLASSVAAQKGELDDLLDSGKKKPSSKANTAGGIDDLLEGKGGGVRFRLTSVKATEKPLADRLFWRTLQGVVAAETVPAELRVDDQTIMASQLDTEADLEGPLAALQPTTGTAKVGTREQFLTPGKILLKPQGGTFAANHPALQWDAKAGEMLVRCAPLRFEFKDAAGRFVGTPLQIQCAGVSLLRKSLRITRLTMWLPVGLTYNSTLGNFAIGGDGALTVYGALPPGVERTELGFCKTVEAESPRFKGDAPTDIVVMKVDKPYSLYLSHRVRPDEPLWLAVARPAYEKSNGVPPHSDHFAQVKGRQTLARAEEVQPTDRNTIQRAAAGLGAKEEHLAWYRIPWLGELGSNHIVIDARFGGHFKHVVLVSEPTQGLFLVSHRLRTVFGSHESPVFHVLVPAGFKNEVATLEATPMRVAAAEKTAPAAINLGSVSLPAARVGDFNSTSFQLHVGALPPGTYALQVRAKNARSQTLRLEVVPWSSSPHQSPRSPFFVHSMVWGGTWPESNEGLAALHDAGIQMVVQGESLDAAVPQLDTMWRGVLDKADSGPIELALQRTRNDMLLERLTRHQIRHVDFAVNRTAGFYNEGLSYHHSYQPSVDRMIRRMQIFTQQTVEYPSAAGVNFSWFPQMNGYVEAGVPTDAHVAERNRVLAEKLENAGYRSISREDRQWLRKSLASKDPADQKRARALEEQDIRYWKEAFKLGFGEHNALYTSAIREVKPFTVNTLYENAGHDSGKRADQLFAGMEATSYFTMTDYGDWPMSAAFTTEWARATTAGNRPIWVTTEGLNTTEGQTKQLFHAFARGLDGGGFPMAETKSIAELRRRGKVLNFLAQYGPIAKYARPDRRVAILATNAKHRFTQNGSYEYHALFYHLTRVGYPPAIIAEDQITDHGIGKETEVLALVNVDRPLGEDVLAAIQSFQKRGGRVVTFGDAVPQVANAIDASTTIQSIWKGPGFQGTAHAWLWDQFDQVQENVAAAIRQAGLQPLASCDPAQGYALTLQGNNVNYVVVIADRHGSHVSEFNREAGLKVAVPCPVGWHVRDLRTQEDLAVEQKAGKVHVTVDLVTEPATILAIYRNVPENMHVLHSTTPDLGNAFHIYDKRSFGPVREVEEQEKKELAFAGWPLLWTWTNPAGQSELAFEGLGNHVRFTTALLAPAGEWTLKCQELITGKTFQVSHNVQRSQDDDTQAPLRALGPTHVVDEYHLKRYLQRDGERVVLLEPGQEALLPAAESLVANLKKLGLEARVWKLQPEDFDTQPNRWFPRKEDSARQALIDAGKLIGHREHLKPFIDKLKAVHVPERGGYASESPDFMFGSDAIVFSGGRLAESLRAVTGWMETPHVPGQGRGRLVVVFSPFAAGKQVLAVVGNDRVGLETAASGIVEFLRKSRIQEFGDFIDLDIQQTEFRFGNAKPVPRPYETLTPHRRVLELVANENGQIAVSLADGGGVAIVNEHGQVTSAIQDVKHVATFDNQGQLWDLQLERAERQLSTSLRCVTMEGKLKFSLPAFSGSAAAPGIIAGYVAAPNGEFAALGQPGKVLLGSPLKGAWHAYDDIPHAQERFAVFYPRMPIAAVFSPDSRYLCVSLDTRPPLNNMSGPVFQPTFAETILIDTQTGKRMWSLRDRTPQRSTYAVHRGFLAVSRDAKRVALADYDGGIYLIDEAGKELVAIRPEKVDRNASSRLGPARGVSVTIADDGSLAAFGFQNRLVLASGRKFVEVPLAGVASLCVTRSGSHVVAATDDGTLLAIEPTGSVRWQKELGSFGMHVTAASGDQVFVGTGEGELLLVDARGEVQRRTAVFEAARKAARPPEKTEDSRQLAEPALYLPANTLELAQRKLQAKPMAAWQPVGTAKESFGQKFYRVEAPVQLSATDAPAGLLHLVYRRPADNTALQVTIRGNGGSDKFDLDLPTPTYRVVDLPLRGPHSQVTIHSSGPVELAECSLWSITWPSVNLALVKVSSPGEKKPVNAAGSADDLLNDLTTGGVKNDLSGRVKDCKIWWPNTDPDRTKGRFLPAPLDPLTMVDGVRFGSGNLQPWASGRSASWGGSLTVDFGAPAELSLVATYDRSTKQSSVNSGLMIFSGAIKGEHDSPPPLGSASDNDQFWRVFEFTPTKIQVLGAHVFANGAACGLSEVEAYR